MCVAIPSKVLEIDGDEALVDCGGIRRRVNTMLAGPVVVGDYVLLHAGCAVQVIDAEEAQKTLELYRELALHMEESDEVR